MFGAIRLIIGLICLVVLVVIIKNSKSSQKRIMYIISVVISVAFITILAFVPFENMFLSFNSPEEAYGYVNFDKSEVDLVVCGDGADLVVDDKDGKYEYLIIPHTEGGWKIGLGIDTKMVFSDLIEGFAIEVYQYKNTNNFFVSVSDTNGGETLITDGYNSQFVALSKENPFQSEAFFTYYTSISEFNSDYFITLNGEKIIEDYANFANIDPTQIISTDELKEIRKQTVLSQNQREELEKLNQGSQIIQNMGGVDSFGPDLLARFGIV